MERKNVFSGVKASSFGSLNLVIEQAMGFFGIK